MDIRQLRYFVAIAECGSLSAATQRLHIVQSALSQCVAELESELQVQLLLRNRHGVMVTAAGQELYEQARLLIRQFQLAGDAVRERAGSTRGHVAVGLLRTLAPELGGKLFYRVRQELPEVTLDILVGYSAELQQRMRAGQLDLTMQVVTPGHRDAGQAALYIERLCVVGKRGVLPHRLKRMRLKHLVGLPLLLSPMQPSHDALIRSAHGAGLELTIAGGVEDSASVLHICRDLGMVTILPESTATRVSAACDLAFRPLAEPALLREVCVVGHPQLPRTGAALAVERILINMLSEFGSEPRREDLTPP